MSRKLFAFLLSELNLVRIKCKKCKKTAELTTEQLSSQFQEPSCPFCHAVIAKGDPTNSPYAKLASAIQSLKNVDDLVEVEFILPDHSDE